MSGNVNTESAMPQNPKFVIETIEEDPRAQRQRLAFEESIKEAKLRKLSHFCWILFSGHWAAACSLFPKYNRHLRDAFQTAKQLCPEEFIPERVLLANEFLMSNIIERRDPAERQNLQKIGNDIAGLIQCTNKSLDDTCNKLFDAFWTLACELSLGGDDEHLRRAFNAVSDFCVVSTTEQPGRGLFGLMLRLIKGKIEGGELSRDELTQIGKDLVMLIASNAQFE